MIIIFELSDMNENNDLKFICDDQMVRYINFMNLRPNIKLNDSIWSLLEHDVRAQKNDSCENLRVVVELCYDDKIKKISPNIECIKAGCSCIRLNNLMYADFSNFRSGRINPVYIRNCSSLRFVICSGRLVSRHNYGLVHAISRKHKQTNSKSLIV